jgi:antitoxin HicB
MVYQALFEAAEEGGYVVTFPDFPWGVTQGETEQEALRMAAEVIEIVIADRIAEGQPLPVQRKRRGKKYRDIRLPALVAAKAELYASFLESGISKAELARRLKIPRMNVDRLFDLQHQSRLDQIEAALRAIGKELEIIVHDAA